MILLLLDRLHAALRVLVGLCFALLLAAVLIQVASRLALPRPPVWTEEFSRFALLFCAALGVGLALRTGQLVGVDVLTMLLPARARAAAEALCCLVMIGFGALLIAPAWAFVDIGQLQTSPALQWNMFWVHMAVLIAPLALILGAAERLLRVLAGRAPEVR